MEQNIIKLKKTGRFSGVYITPYEMDLLRLVFDLKVISSRNIHNFYQAHSLPSRSSNAITNRLAKLVNAGVLQRLDDSHVLKLDPRPVSYYYRVGTRGFELLQKEGFISEDEMEYGKMYGSIFPIPTDHNKALGNLLMNTQISLSLSGASFDSLATRSMRGDRHPEFSVSVHQLDFAPIIPDWIFETEEQIICLELDTGSQKTGIIQSKFYRYNKMAKRLNKPLVVFFSVGLDVVAEVTNRERRVPSLKEVFPEQTEWSNSLDIYVVPSGRTVLLLKRLIERNARFSREEQKQLTMKWLRNSFDAAPFGIYFEKNEDQQFQSLLFNNEFDLDNMGLIDKEHDENQYGGLLFMEEGSVRSYQRVRVNQHRISHWNENRAVGRGAVSLFLIYEEKSSIEPDILGIIPLCETWLFSIDAVRKASLATRLEYPPATIMLSQYRREERKFV